MLPVVLLNPSVAGEAIDDATVRWLRGYTARHGFGGVCLANLSPFVQTRLSEDDVSRASPDTGRQLLGLTCIFESAKHGCGWVLCGWGDGVRKLRDPTLGVSVVGALAAAYRVELRALGTTARGNPWHPLRKSHSLVAQPWAQSPE
jgi:hypothetical protein